MKSICASVENQATDEAIIWQSGKRSKNHEIRLF